MGVPTPKSGDLITKTSITDMYDAVRTIVNAQNEETFSRGTFGPQHVPSLVLGADFRDVTTSVAVAGSPFGAGTPPPVFDEATTYAAWQTLTPYTMDNGGAGYTLYKGIVLMFASIRWQDTEISGVAGINAQELWFNFNYTINGVLYQLPLHNRMLRNVVDADGSSLLSEVRIVEETVTWWNVFEWTSPAPTFNFKMGVKAVCQRAVGAKTDPCTLPNGHIGFVNLYGG